MKTLKFNLKFAVILALTIVLAVAGLTGCGNTEKSDKTHHTTTSEESKSKDGDRSDQKYQYGSVDIPGKDGALCAAPIYVAYEKGFFADEGFNVNLISADVETKKTGLNNGTIPIVNGDFQFFPSIEEGVKVKVVDGLHNGCIKFVVKKGSNIRNAQDLKNKVIGVDEIGGTPHQVASVWLEQHGISAKEEKKEVTFRAYSDGNNELEALYNGDIDVAAMWDPLGSVSAKEGKTKIIFDLATDKAFKGKYCCFLYASEKVLNENPEKVAALLRAYRKAQNWIAENPEETVDLILKGKYSQIDDKKLATELIQSYSYPSDSDHNGGKTHVKSDVRYFVNELHDIGYLKSDPDEFTDKIYEKVDTDQ